MFLSLCCLTGACYNCKQVRIGMLSLVLMAVDSDSNHFQLCFFFKKWQLGMLKSLGERGCAKKYYSSQDWEDGFHK